MPIFDIVSIFLILYYPYKKNKITINDLSLKFELLELFEG